MNDKQDKAHKEKHGTYCLTGHNVSMLNLFTQKEMLHT